GLAVFAKWPICGWYYPGIIEGLGGNKWRETPTVGVFFYDGLRREMKNFNILPADVIPTGSVLCTIDDEAEMTVMTCERESENSVEFTLMKKEKEEGEDEIVKMNFSKLAIKGDSMKIIKQQLEEQHIDVLPKNTNAVSLGIQCITIFLIESIIPSLPICCPLLSYKNKKIYNLKFNS
ncbi:hypothetical protein AAG570_004159, partial [Ranatra chinensis]